MSVWIDVETLNKARQAKLFRISANQFDEEFFRIVQELRTPVRLEERFREFFSEKLNIEDPELIAIDPTDVAHLSVNFVVYSEEFPAIDGSEKLPSLDVTSQYQDFKNEGGA